VLWFGAHTTSALVVAGLVFLISLGLPPFLVFCHEFGLDVALDRLAHDEREFRLENDRWIAQERARTPTTLPDGEKGKALPDIALEARWQTNVRIFFREGDRAGGFSARKLEGVVGSDVWGQLTDFYIAQGILWNYGGNVGTAWNTGWSLGRVLSLVALPHPDGEPPKVSAKPHGAVLATQRNTHNAGDPASAIVDG